MSHLPTPPKKWRDENGNLYTVEQSTRNKQFVVIRTNPGGNRKAAKQFCQISGSDYVCRVLNEYAKLAGWVEISQ